METRFSNAIIKIDCDTRLTDQQFAEAVQRALHHWVGATIPIDAKQARKGRKPFISAHSSEVH